MATLESNNFKQRSRPITDCTNRSIAKDTNIIRPANGDDLPADGIIWPPCLLLTRVEPSFEHLTVNGTRGHPRELNSVNIKHFFKDEIDVMIDEWNAHQIKHDYGPRGYGGFSYIIMGSRGFENSYQPECYEICEKITRTYLPQIFKKYEQYGGPYANLLTHFNYCRMAKPRDLESILSKYSRSFKVVSRHQYIEKPKLSMAHKLEQMEELAKRNEEEAIKRRKENEDLMGRVNMMVSQLNSKYKNMQEQYEARLEQGAEREQHLYVIP